MNSFLGKYTAQFCRVSTKVGDFVKGQWQQSGSCIVDVFALGLVVGNGSLRMLLAASNRKPQLKVA